MPVGLVAIPLRIDGAERLLPEEPRHFGEHDGLARLDPGAVSSPDETPQLRTIDRLADLDSTDASRINGSILRLENDVRVETAAFDVAVVPTWQECRERGQRILRSMGVR